MIKEALIILSNKIRKNMISLLVLVLVFIVTLIFSGFICRYMGNVSFYFNNRNYDMLITRNVTDYEYQSYFLDTDYMLQINNKNINAQGIMLKPDCDCSAMFGISEIDVDEIVISKGIALSKFVSVGDTVKIDINYNHKLKEFRVVGISDYLFDITQDINVLGSNVFFVGYDEGYVNNSTLRVVSFIDTNIENLENIELDNIIASYSCNSRFLMNVFLLCVLIIINVFIIILGYSIFVKTLNCLDDIKRVRYSGVSYMGYKKLTLWIRLFEILSYFSSVLLVSIIGLIFSIKFVYCLICFFVLLAICCCVLISITKKKSAWRLKND